MEAVGLGVGIVSLASIFQTCLHGYRSLNTAMTIGNTALTLNVQFRVEELRLYLWGRNWGLILEQVDDTEAIDEKATAISQKDETRLDSVDEELEIPGLRDLTIDILGRIQNALQEWKSIGEKYSSNFPTDRGSVPSKESSRDLIAKISTKQTTQSKDISSRTKFSSKLRWAMTDKGNLEELLTKLTSLNNSLDKLLPKRERSSLARGLAGELLNLLESSKKTAAESDVAELLGHLGGLDEVKAARIVRLKHLNRTEKGERASINVEKESGTHGGDGPTPFAKPSVWTDGTEGDMHIPFTEFVRLAQPKIQYYQIHKSKDRWISGRYAPLPRSMAIFAPSTPETEAKIPSNAPAQMTMVEWRPTAHESRASELTEEELKERRDHIARLLRRTAETDADFRVLNCLGYTTAPGHTPDGATHDLVGYVYQYPEFASPKSLPVTLREILGEAYHSNDPDVPDLESRFRLARSLSIALYQLQCAGWVHRKISSYNIMFFRDRISEKLDLTQPFLVGWQYSRPDDQRRIWPSESNSSSGGIADLDMYVHRRRLVKSRAQLFPRYRKSFDIYSLGIVLIEIAFWEPIISLASAKDREKMEKFEDVDSDSRAKEWWKAISKTAKQELAAEMGAGYRDAVLYCLEGSGEADAKRFDEQSDQLLREHENSGNNRDAYYEDSNFEEVGIEKDFYWRVLKALEQFRM